MSFGANTWIVVREGRKRISEIVPGEWVLTSTGRFHPVAAVIDEGLRPMIQIKTSESRSLLISEDQQVGTAHRKNRSTVWKTLHEFEDISPFADEGLTMVQPHGNFNAFADQTDTDLHRLAVMLGVLTMGVKRPEGGWVFHKYDQGVDHSIEKLGLRYDQPKWEAPVLHEVPYLEDTPVANCTLPRVFFAADRRTVTWMVNTMLSMHGASWPWEAGYYLRTSSYVAASHLQHVLFRAGILTGIDSGNRWLLGEGPVWRVQARNPKDHAASRTRMVKFEAVDYMTEAHELPTERRAFSLVLSPGATSFTANDFAVRAGRQSEAETLKTESVAA